jgi:hypothetical protein
MSMKRMLATMLMALVALPWAVMPATAGSACAMPGVRVSSCSYCAATAPSASEPFTLRSGCCRFLPATSLTPAPATGVSLTPKPHHAPDAIATTPGPTAPPCLAAPRLARDAARSGPAHAPPTETTHLLI